MIHSIKSDKSSFKTITFNDGLNVVLAERTKESTKKDSRNGLGKSTMIEIIHFCLGANKGETLKNKKLDDWTFSMDIDIGNKMYTISRNTNDQGKIFVDGDFTDWKIKPSLDEESGGKMFGRNEWNIVLGTMLFNLQPRYNFKYHPKFRSLISYFVRRNGKSGAFLDPFLQYRIQHVWDMQLHNAYLLDLGWEFASKWQVLKDRQKIIEQIEEESQTGLISNIMGNMGELEALKIRLSDKIKQEKENLDDFKVHEQYHQIELDVNEITKTIHDLVNENIDGKRLIEHYNSSLKEEIDAKPDQVTRIYQEAGIIIPKNVERKINEVLDFHKKVVANRKIFLTSEMQQIRTKIINREQKIQDLDSKKAELMKTLKTHGALDEYLQLQTNHQSTVSLLNDVLRRLDNLRKFEEGKSSIVLEQEMLRQQAIADLNERSLQKEEAIRSFNQFSEKLYNGPGTLSINIDSQGYRFNVHIERSSSHGVENMKIFCYDLTLIKMWAKKIKSVPFLIHDSILFDPVDERQVALAIQLAESESRQEKFQYICTMNSDMIPRDDFDKEFQFDKYVIQQFTDSTPDGGILGIRF